jgi:BioD-like phosphotransacetylase family protein
MPALLIAAPTQRSGKTALAAAFTQRLVYAGRRAVALRLGAGGDVGAAADAAFFATLPGARGRGGQPIPAADAAGEIARLAGDGVAVVEAGENTDIVAVATALDAATVLVQRGLPDDDAVLALQELALALGARFVGVVLFAVPAVLLGRAAQVLDDAALPLLVALPEDRLLAAPTIGEIAAFLPAEFLLGEEDADLVVEELMINPISADPGQAYYARRRNKAVITRSDKTDSQLAALASNTDCLLLTGGLMPSPYTLDRAANEEVAVLLARPNTLQTVRRLEDIFGTTRFGSERKLERVVELLNAGMDWQTLDRALAASSAPAV